MTPQKQTEARSIKCALKITFYVLKAISAKQPTTDKVLECIRAVFKNHINTMQLMLMCSVETLSMRAINIGVHRVCQICTLTLGSIKTCWNSL